MDSRGTGERTARTVIDRGGASHGTRLRGLYGFSCFGARGHRAGGVGRGRHDSAPGRRDIAPHDPGGKSPAPGETPAQNAFKGPSGEGTENALVDALEQLFEKSLAEAAAEAVKGEDGEVKNADGAEEITQEQAEKLYEEMMAK